MNSQLEVPSGTRSPSACAFFGSKGSSLPLLAPECTSLNSFKAGTLFIHPTRQSQRSRCLLIRWTRYSPLPTRKRPYIFRRKCSFGDSLSRLNGCWHFWFIYDYDNGLVEFSFFWTIDNFQWSIQSKVAPVGQSGSALQDTVSRKTKLSSTVNRRNQTIKSRSV